MKRLLIAVAALGAAACSSGSGALYDSPTSLAGRMAESEIARNPSPTNLDGIPAGKVKWNYTTGLELLAIRDAGEAWERPDFIAYADRYFDTIVQPDGSVLTYRKEKYNLDHICPGRALFGLYTRTKEPRYRQVLDTLYSQLRAQPRNFDGGFWHNQIYPHQMWLDGLYMAEPFYAEYAMKNLTGAALDDAVADIVNQFVVVGKHTWDPATGLYRHAYDDSREMFWCDSITGQSAHAWCRAMGWYAMAIVETMQYLGKTDATRPMLAILERIYDVLPKYADPETGMWYQVLDQPGREGNYLESTGDVRLCAAEGRAAGLPAGDDAQGGAAPLRTVCRPFRAGECRRHDLADGLLCRGRAGRKADAQRHVRILHLGARH